MPATEFEHALEHISCFVCREAFDRHHGDAENHHQAEFLLIAFDRRREPLERLQATPGQRLGFVMRGSILCVSGRVKEIFDRAWIIATLLEMHREFRGDFADAVPIDRFAPLTDSTMDLRAPHRRQQSVRHLQVQNVAELVARRHRAVGQLDEPPGREKLIPSDERFAAFLDPLGGFVESGSDRHR